MKESNSGQSLIEVIFAMVVVVLVLTGIMVLLINSVGSRTKTFDRQTATYVAQTVMEGLLESKINSPTNFWSRFESGDYGSELGGLLGDGYDNYPYDVAYQQIINGPGNPYPECNQRPGIVDCVEISVTVHWKAGDEYLTVRRFFSR